MKRTTPKKIAILNFGGIGDEILFSPVIDALKAALSDSALTLILEKRSAGIAPLLPRMSLQKQDSVVSIDLAEYSRKQLFFKLRHMLIQGRYDAVLSSGSSPFIALMLFSTGIPYRVGYHSGPLARFLLSRRAPLSTGQYASQMYFSLVQAFLEGLFELAEFQPYPPAQPVLASPHLDHLQWAIAMLGEIKARLDQPIILIHPGVSLMSVEKNILKNWPAASWAALLQDICVQRSDAQFILLGGPDDEVMIAQIRNELATEYPKNLFDWYGKTRSLEQLAALIYQADMLISADSAPLHLAVGYRKPVVAMFGPTDEKKLLPPQGPYHAVTVQDLACRPCLWDVRSNSCDTPVCLEVPVNAMTRQVLDLLQQVKSEGVSY